MLDHSLKIWRALYPLIQMDTEAVGKTLAANILEGLQMQGACLHLRLRPLHHKKKKKNMLGVRERTSFKSRVCLDCLANAID